MSISFPLIPPNFFSRSSSSSTTSSSSSSSSSSSFYCSSSYKSLLPLSSRVKVNRMHATTSEKICSPDCQTRSPTSSPPTPPPQLPPPPLSLPQATTAHHTINTTHPRPQVNP
ncbi:hypothetical protein E2C01_092947 [Portunus trituberculatus]|uniref:Uncharacterized protein n=1 Tax=Portunus trituberculatus TaxID=210409 RepID=A0A5B7JT89_PORTR|nr:hypothetical protein [Portunus trituberculatus]